METASIRVPFHHATAVTERFSLDHEALSGRTGLNTQIQTNKRKNNERCADYRRRKKMKEQQLAEELVELTRRNGDLKLLVHIKEAEVEKFKKLLMKK